jgi:hypothetical protein
MATNCHGYCVENQVLPSHSAKADAHPALHLLRHGQRKAMQVSYQWHKYVAEQELEVRIVFTGP